MGLVAAFGLGVILLTFLNCRPFSKTWNPGEPGICGSLLEPVLATSVINMLVDLTIICMPMPLVWNLQMATWRKTALTFTFGLGLV